jgi:hypothetical protein
MMSDFEKDILVGILMQDGDLIQDGEVWRPSCQDFPYAIFPVGASQNNSVLDELKRLVRYTRLIGRYCSSGHY